MISLVKYKFSYVYTDYLSYHSVLPIHGQGSCLFIKDDDKQASKMSRMLWTSLTSHLDARPLALVWFPKMFFCNPKATISASSLDKCLCNLGFAFFLFVCFSPGSLTVSSSMSHFTAYGKIPSNINYQPQHHNSAP